MQARSSRSARPLPHTDDRLAADLLLAQKLQEEEDAQGMLSQPKPKPYERTQKGRGPVAQTEDTLAADLLLAQMLQEEEDAQGMLSQPNPSQKTKQKGKRQYKPLNISYVVAQTGAQQPALGTAAPSSLADILRNRRSQEQRAPNFAADFGAAPRPSALSDSNGLTWAERAQLAQQKPDATAPILNPTAAFGPRHTTLVKLKISTAQGAEHFLEVDLEETAGEVKTRLEKMLGLATASQRLLHMGRELNDAEQLTAISGSMNGAGVCHLQLAMRQVVQAHHQAPAVSRAPGQSQDSRRDLIKAVFKTLDRTSKGHLTAADMRPFAEQTGFSGSDHEWQEEFALLCRDRGSAKGIKLEEFVQLVNDSSDEGCYCSDSELRALLQQQQQQQQQPPPSTTPVKAAPVASKAAAAGVAPSRAPAKDSRQDLIDAVFNALDRTGRGFLTAADMRPFAEQTGFTGTDEEWRLEFEALCQESRSSQGLGLDAFAKLVNDDSEDGCYCTDSELQALLQRLHQGSVDIKPSVSKSTPSRTIRQPLVATEANSRRGCIEAVFTALDTAGNGFLAAGDMRPFAEQTGFTGTDLEWQLEFEALCHESRSSQGLGLEEFAKLVNDDSEDGCYCTDSELQALLQRLHQHSISSSLSLSNATRAGIGEPLPPMEAMVRPPPGLLPVERPELTSSTWQPALRLR